MKTSATPARTAVIITAAGSGTRLGYGAPKALVPLDAHGRLGDASCLLAVALRNTEQVPHLNQIVITAPPEDLEVFTQVASSVQTRCEVHVTVGGNTRQASVFAGLQQLEQVGFGTVPSDVVLVHDAARALTDAAMMQRVIDAVQAGSVAVIPALPVVDTLKQVEPESDQVGVGIERVTGNIDRSIMRSVQTPQGFPFEKLVEAHRLHQNKGLHDETAATDDSTIMQWEGYPVDCVLGDSQALKITTPLDLALARILYEQLSPTQGQENAQ